MVKILNTYLMTEKKTNFSHSDCCTEIPLNGLKYIKKKMKGRKFLILQVKKSNYFSSRKTPLHSSHMRRDASERSLLFKKSLDSTSNLS